MLEEAPVFDRKHGVAQHFRNVVEADGPALLAGTVKQAGQQFRLDLGGIQRRAGIHGADLLDFVAAEIHDQPVFPSEIRFARRANFDFVAVQNVAPGSSRNIQFAVPGALQVIGHVRRRSGFRRWRSASERHKSGPWSAEYARKDADRSSGHRKSSNTSRCRRRQGEEISPVPSRDQAKPGCPKTPADSNTQGSSPFRREKTVCSPQYPSSPRCALDAPHRNKCTCRTVRFRILQTSGEISPAGGRLLTDHWLGPVASEHPTRSLAR